jgi:hypothetical protein
MAAIIGGAVGGIVLLALAALLVILLVRRRNTINPETFRIDQPLLDHDSYLTTDHEMM